MATIVAIGVVLLAASPARAEPPTPTPTVSSSPSRALGETVRSALVTAGFDRLVDFGPESEGCPGGPGCPDLAPPAVLPSVDAAVIELDAAGVPIRAADVLLDRDHPSGLVLDVDAAGPPAPVRWFRWDGARTDAADPAATSVPWSAVRIAADDVVPGREGAPATFMSPYPGSAFRLLVAAYTLHLADGGVIDLDAPYHYLQAPGSTCLGERFELTESTRSLLERSLIEADAPATCVLIHQLHALDQIAAMNAWYAGLGLPTLQVNGTDAGSGGRWLPGEITMTALDTARLLVAVNAADPRVLTAASAELLTGWLGDQGFAEMLSTANWCGRTYPAAGIPQAVPPRWVDPAQGTVSVGRIPYGQDVRPCAGTAQVRFAHLTGLSRTAAADAGIVHSLTGLSGVRERHYVVAVISDAGSRYADAGWASSATLPCSTDVCYTEAFARLGAAIDDAMGR
jgi:hypothetical protein